METTFFWVIIAVLSIIIGCILEYVEYLERRATIGIERQRYWVKIAKLWQAKVSFLEKYHENENRRFEEQLTILKRELRSLIL